jgi:hypothetical protein
VRWIDYKAATRLTEKDESVGDSWGLELVEKRTKTTCENKLKNAQKIMTG